MALILRLVALRRALGLLLGRSIIGCVLLITILQSLVEYADPLNAVARLLLRLELEAHLDLVILLSLICELVRDIWILVIGAQNSITRLWRVAGLQCIDLLVILDRLVVIGIVFAKLRNSKVECNDFCTTFPGSNFDEIVHKESRLDKREGLAQADSRVLCDDN